MYSRSQSHSHSPSLQSPPPPSSVTSSSSPSSSTPSRTVNRPSFQNSLYEIATSVTAIRTQVKSLQALFAPGARTSAKELKRVLKETHRDLERLQSAADECGDVTVAMGELTRQAWRTYRALVRMEERVQRLGALDGAGGDGGVDRGSAGEEVSKEQRGNGYGDENGNRKGKGKAKEEAKESKVKSGVEMGGKASKWREPPSTYMHTGIPTGANVANMWRVKSAPASTSLYAIQGKADEEGNVHRRSSWEGPNSESSWVDASVEDNDENSDDERGRTSSTEDRDDRHTQKDYSRAVKPIHVVSHSVQRSMGGPVLVRGRTEVERNCAYEERARRPILRSPDRRREGSTANGYYATMLVVQGNNDERFVMAKLRYIKMHEVKELCRWLAEKKYVRRTGSMSRMEKVLQLLFVLQEGCRIETMAVLFSRTPRQVRQACKEVMQGLLELHSETSLPRRQPTCDGLWNISVQFFNEEDKVRRAEGYYGWEMWDIIKVLVTVNLFIGRFRQQGRFSLDGACYHWWRAFGDGGQGGISQRLGIEDV